MAKRFTDTDKWKDEWYTELTSDYKIIWQYLLDTCDNAGIYKRNIKLLNYYCNTNVSAEDILKVFNKRVTQLADDKWLINKFCVYQYGNDFLDSTNKAVMSAHKILEQNGIIKPTGKMIDYQYGKEVRQRKEYSVLIDFNNPIDTISVPNQYSIDTLSIPYQYSIDTPKEQDKVKDKVKDKVEDKVEDEEVVKDSEKSIIQKALRSLMQTEDMNEYNKGVDIIDEYGGCINAIELIKLDDDVKENWIRKIKSTSAILQMNYSN